MAVVGGDDVCECPTLTFNFFFLFLVGRDNKRNKRSIESIWIGANVWDFVKGSNANVPLHPCEARYRWYLVDGQNPIAGITRSLDAMAGCVEKEEEKACAHKSLRQAAREQRRPMKELLLIAEEFTR